MRQLNQIPETLISVMEESIAVQRAVLGGCGLQVEQIARCLADALRSGHKILLFGNGGSAGDAQHVATEFVGRFLKNRRSLPAIALTTDGTLLTSIANDYAFEEIFARQVDALAQPGDVVVGISTSGNSPNVLKGIAAGRARGAVTVGFTGRGGLLAEAAHHCLCVPSGVTARIQEAHIIVWHAICQMIDEAVAD